MPLIFVASPARCRYYARRSEPEFATLALSRKWGRRQSAADVILHLRPEHLSKSAPSEFHTGWSLNIWSRERIPSLAVCMQIFVNVSISVCAAAVEWIRRPSVPAPQPNLHALCVRCGNISLCRLCCTAGNAGQTWPPRGFWFATPCWRAYLKWISRVCTQKESAQLIDSSMFSVLIWVVSEWFKKCILTTKGPLKWFIVYS